MKKKIGVLGAKGFPGFGGVSGASENIFTRLTEKYDITIYAIDTHAIQQEYKGLKQVIFKSYRNQKLTTFSYYLKSLIHALFIKKFDLIHVNHISSGIFILFLRIRFRVLCNVRGLNYNNDDKWNHFYKTCMKFSDYLSRKYANTIVTVQKGSIDYLKSPKKNNVFFIPNGVDDLHFYLDETKEYDIVFSAARIIYLKGLHDLLKALIKLKFKGKILVIGDLNQVESYKHKIMKLSQGLNIEFKGLVKEKNILYSLIGKSKLFVFPSYTEGMSNMLLEVASIGTPILASDINQNKEVFTPDEISFFNVGDIKNLARNVNHIFSDYDCYKEKTNLAYQKVKQKHEWNDIAKEYSTIYDNVIS